MAGSDRLDRGVVAGVTDTIVHDLYRYENLHSGPWHHLLGEIQIHTHIAFTLRSSQTDAGSPLLVQRPRLRSVTASAVGRAGAVQRSLSQRTRRPSVKHLRMGFPNLELPSTEKSNEYP